MDFHHLDPSKKDFGIGSKGETRSWDKTKKELDKCILVCSNCHREIHAGLISLPETLGNSIIDSTNGFEPLNESLSLSSRTKIKPSQIDPNWRKKDKLNRRKVERPTKEELEKLVWEKPTVELSKQFGISDVAVGKWCKRYGIEKPPRGYWEKRKHGGLVK